MERRFGRGVKSSKQLNGKNGKHSHRDADDEGIRARPVDMELYRQAIKDLARSGLDKKDYKRLRLEVMDRDATDAFVGEERASYRIPYFDLDGKRIAYSRVRFLENKKGRGFKSASREGTHRYSQKANTPPHVYYAPYFNWRKLAKDAGQKLLITEGEKKAAAACKAGIACIALGGVFSFQSSKRHQPLIPDLEQIDWKDREVEICYDADVMVNANVYTALERLAVTLMGRGTKSISFIYFDAEGAAGNKTGLDDFLLEYGVEAFEKLERQEHDASHKIDALNQKVCYIRSAHIYWDILNKKAFKSLYNVRECFAAEGVVSLGPTKSMPVIDMWNTSPKRRTVHNVEYIPGQPPLTKEDVLNTWVPPDIQPKKGKVQRWLDLVAYVMREGEYVDWFLKWLAYPVQHPGTKLFQAPFVFSPQTGVGKTFIVDPVMEYIYGKSNFYRLSSDDLTSKHNTFAGNSVFVVTNEVWLPEFKDRTSAMSMLKDMITRERVTIDEKFMPKMKFDDRCNYYFSSNHADALMLEPEDRRFFVIEAPRKKLSITVYRELDDWVRNKDGAAMILHYLANLDLGDFHPKAPALETKWREQLIGLSRDPLTDFVDRLVKNPEHLFMVNGSLPDLQLYRAEDIVTVFVSAYPRSFVPTPSRMARLLINAKLEKRQVRLSKGKPLLTLYPVFKGEHWGTKRNVDWAEHYTDKSRLYGGKSRH
jgi:hypothetical protein